MPQDPQELTVRSTIGRPAVSTPGHEGRRALRPPRDRLSREAASQETAFLVGVGRFGDESRLGQFAAQYALGRAGSVHTYLASCLG